jgi:hypothetical protein
MILAKFQPLPPVDACLTASRCEEIHRGGGFTKQEEEHLAQCDWCWATVLCGTDSCLDAWQLIELTSGREPTAEEAEHLRLCPGCAYDFSEIACQPTAEIGQRPIV